MPNTRPLPEQLGFSTTWFDLPGLRMHAATAGPADGPLVILLHGFPEFWYSWRQVIPQLTAAGYRVVAPDQRGYNLTDKTPPFDIDTLTDDIAHLIDACGHERVYLVGHDWGAAVAWVFAMRFPERLLRLAILNVPHPATLVRAFSGRQNLAQLFKSWYIFFFQIPGLPEWLLRANNFHFARQIMTSSSRRGTFTTADLDAYVSAWGQPGALTATINWYRAFIRTGAQQRRAGQLDAWEKPITVPTIILWGEKDVALTIETAEASVPYLEQGELIKFPRATHWVHEEFPNDITQHLLAHFASERAKPASTPAT